MSIERYQKISLRRFEILGLLPDVETVKLWHKCGNGFTGATRDTFELAAFLPDECSGYLGQPTNGHRNKGWIVQIIGKPFAVETLISVDPKKAKRLAQRLYKDGQLEAKS